MKKPNLNLKKTANNFFAYRFTLVIAILALTLSMGNSQNLPDNSDYRPVSKPSDVEKVQPLNIQQNAEKNAVIVSKKPGSHAPQANDPDYEAKKAEWMKNYPDEYNALQQTSPGINSDQKNTNTGVSAVSNANVLKQETFVQKKAGEHAPAFDDPDYEAKKIEWIKNYPEEYNAFGGIQENISISNNEVVKPNNAPQPASKPHTKIAEHAPYLDDSNYEAKKVEWIHNYPDEFEAVLQKSSGSKINYNSEAPKVENQPAVKIAEHAPYMNDPEYGTKKAEWIKNYPDEYNAVMNINAGSNKNTNATPISQPVKQTSGQTNDKNKPGFDATRK